MTAVEQFGCGAHLENIVVPGCEACLLVAADRALARGQEAVAKLDATWKSIPPEVREQVGYREQTCPACGQTLRASQARRVRPSGEQVWWPLGALGLIWGFGIGAVMFGLGASTVTAGALTAAVVASLLALFSLR